MCDAKKGKSRLNKGLYNICTGAVLSLPHMPDGPVYRINTPQVIHQTIDGEVVVINLDTGTYFSLTESAQTIWSVLEGGAGKEEVIAILEKNYSGVAGEIESHVTKFFDELIAEKLIVPSQPAEIKSNPIADSVNLGSKVPFVPPALKKFTDMQELLLLDPVHEVDATGWPQANPPGAHAK